MPSSEWGVEFRFAPPEGISFHKTSRVYLALRIGKALGNGRIPAIESEGSERRPKAYLVGCELLGADDVKIKQQSTDIVCAAMDAFGFGIDSVTDLRLVPPSNTTDTESEVAILKPMQRYSPPFNHPK